MDSINFKNAISSLQGNPIAVSSLCLDALEQTTNGVNRIVDPSNPFVYLLETAIVLSADSIDKNMSSLYKLYESNARNWEDLFRHMSDFDYADLYASPGQSKIMFMLDVEEIKSKAIDIGDGSGNRKLTIARNSRITVSDTHLTMLYPIDIIVTPFQSVIVKYDTKIKNPLQTIATPDIMYEFRKFNSTIFLFFEIPILQIEVSSSTSSISASTGLKRRINYNDSFYYLRAFMRNDNEDWQELVIRHNPNIIDVNVPSVCVKVMQKSVEIEIPQVYKNTGMLKDNIRIDIYTTKGGINIPLANVNENLFKANWIDNEEIVKNKFSSAMLNFRNLIIAANSYITGGSNGKTFSEVRERVVNRSNRTEGLPITIKQLDARLKDNNFETMVIYDNVTDRNLLSTKMLPTPVNLTSSPLGTLTTVHSTTQGEMVTNKNSVRNNTNQLTVLPNALFTFESGRLNIVSDSVVEGLLNRNTTPLEDLIDIVNNGNYFYCPYFMVHDFKNNRYTVKPYRLDKPKVVSKSIENENQYIGMSSNILGYAIDLYSDYTGYRLRVQIQPSKELIEESVENLHLQMRINDENNRHYYWFNANLISPIDPSTEKPVDNQYIYEFRLPTNWEFTTNGELIITPYSIPFKLDNEIDIFTIIKKDGLGAEYSTEMDRMIDVESLSSWTIDTSEDYYVVIQERLRVILGKHQKRLWRRARTALEETKYQVHTRDVFSTYENDVFAKDRWGNDQFTYKDGKLVFTKIHSKGDPVIDEVTGLPKVRFYKDDLVYDADGQPIPVGGAIGLVRQYDLTLFDGRYYFATHQPTLQYRESLKDDIDGYLDLIEGLSSEFLERTDIYFHPKTTEGEVRMVVDNNVEIIGEIAQDLKVVYLVEEATRENVYLNTLIKSKTIDILNKVIKSRQTVSKTDIISELKKQMGDMVLGIRITGWLNNLYETMSLLDNSVEISLPKRLALTSNLELIVEDNITVEFITHSKTTNL